MPTLENAHTWTFPATASTGGLKAYDARGYAGALSVFTETGAGCTATVNMQARIGSSSGAWATLSTVSLSTSQGSMVQFLGPMQWLRPYCPAKTTGVLTVQLLGN